MTEVVVGALVRARRVLLVHRRPDKHVYPDVWELPGGVVEPGEAEPDALRRELHEELGVWIDLTSAFPLAREVVHPHGARVVLGAWLVRDWTGTPGNVAPEEHDDIGWFGVDDLPPPAHEHVRATLVAAMRDLGG